mmetsp:Transcript_8954/g.19718  ORF Transcript_8954/g.19718 Transcript_8954/m.19718 type:complete len:244 (-) Transcript_8954:54-785(-)
MRGVQPSRSGWLESTPGASSSIVTARTSPALQAVMSAVQPAALAVLGLALAGSTRSSMAGMSFLLMACTSAWSAISRAWSVCPAASAMRWAVTPWSMTTSASAPACSSSSIISLPPEKAAIISAVQPSFSRRFTSAPALRSIQQASIWFPSTAKMSGVQPSRFWKFTRPAAISISTVGKSPMRAACRMLGSAFPWSELPSLFSPTLNSTPTARVARQASARRVIKFVHFMLRDFGLLKPSLLV